MRRAQFRTNRLIADHRPQIRMIAVILRVRGRVRAHEVRAILPTRMDRVRFVLGRGWRIVTTPLRVLARIDAKMASVLPEVDPFGGRDR